MDNARKSSNEVGQALVEYLLLMTVAIGVASAFGNSIRGAILGFWTYITRSVTAGCPTGCPTRSGYRL